LGLERRQLPADFGRKIRLEALVDHLLVGGGGKIKSGVGHEEASLAQRSLLISPAREQL
jgi:hypothetical protein